MFDPSLGKKKVLQGGFTGNNLFNVLWHCAPLAAS